jgi:probable phosphoglycerate mutase
VSPPARLVLIRHGESAWNAEGRLQGQADPPLSERGRAQIAALRPLLADLEPDGVTVSDLARARESAAILGWPDAAPDAAWREVDIGAWAGRLSAEVREADGEAFLAWREGRRAAPGGEDAEAFAARVVPAARALLGRGGTQVVVCHGGPIRVACAGLLGLALHQLGGLGNASATALEQVASGVRLAMYNLGGGGGEDLGA